MTSQFTAPVTRESNNNNSAGFKKADMFANSSSIVLKDGREIPLYAQKGMPLFIGQQRDATAKAILEQIHAKQAAGEDVEVTFKVMFRGHKPDVVADPSVSLDDLI